MLLDVIDKRVTLKKDGANLLACCPFHEKKPLLLLLVLQNSFTIVLVVVTWLCISFLIEYEGLTFIEAINDLANSIGLKVPNESIHKK